MLGSVLKRLYLLKKRRPGSKLAKQVPRPRGRAAARWYFFAAHIRAQLRCRSAMWNEGVSRLSIKFIVSEDASLLSEYYALRERCYREELGLADFDGSEEDHDKQGCLVLAVRGKQCVGGVRIADYVALPSLADHLSIDQDTCCTWERFVVDPEVRSLTTIRRLVARLVIVSREIGYENAMVLSSLANARFYRRCLSSMQVPFNIERNVPHCAQGSFAGLEHYLSVAAIKEGESLRMAI